MKLNTRCVPKTPSIRISKTSMLMSKNPTYTNPCKIAGIGRTPIFPCPNATRNMVFQRSEGRSKRVIGFPNFIFRINFLTFRLKNHMAKANKMTKIILSMYCINYSSLGAACFLPKIENCTYRFGFSLKSASNSSSVLEVLVKLS